MECLKAIVKGPAVGQAAKGILTAGAYKTVLYSYAKLVKMVKSYSVGLGTNALFISIYCLVRKQGKKVCKVTANCGPMFSLL